VVEATTMKVVIVVVSIEDLHVFARLTIPEGQLLFEFVLELPSFEAGAAAC